MEEKLALNKVFKSYNHGKEKITVVKNVSMKVKSQEVICLFGRSGSGKTTLLNLMGGLDIPDKGKVIINKRDINNIPLKEKAKFRRQNIGFVFQYFNLIPYLTALENVSLPLKYEGIPKPKRLKRAKDILLNVGLGKRLDYKMAALSGGQIQRVAFARAAVMEPAIILADEPTGMLDSKSASDMAALIQKLNQEKKLTFVIATHDLVFKSISSKVVHMDSGNIQEEL